MVVCLYNVKVHKNISSIQPFSIQNQSKLPMKKLLFIISLFVFLFSSAQNKAVIEWLNVNAIPIEDATPKTPPNAFATNVPQKFKDARIFGFGEATHHGKEFFDLKAKFFKYLVENQGVKVFILESGYPNCREINQWLNGGTKTSREMADQLGFVLWMCEEMTELLQWMKDYNADKALGQRIRFYGMDDQFAYGINTQVRQFVTRYKLNIPEQQLVAADSISALQYVKNAPEKEWLGKMAGELAGLKTSLQKQTTAFTGNDRKEADETLHGIDVLCQFTALTATPGIALRDEHMFQNVQWIMRQHGEDSKAFIWAHNGHINKNNLAGFNVHSVGRKLKDYYSDAYYSMGFDFASGRLYTTIVDKSRNTSASVYVLDAPAKNTYANTFAKTLNPIFFIDMDTAVKNPAINKFLSSDKKQYYGGGGGFLKNSPTGKNFKYPEDYDGLIFVRDISVPHYIKEAVPARFYIE